MKPCIKRQKTLYFFFFFSFLEVLFRNNVRLPWDYLKFCLETMCDSHGTTWVVIGSLARIQPYSGGFSLQIFSSNYEYRVQQYDKRARHHFLMPKEKEYDELLLGFMNYTNQSLTRAMHGKIIKKKNDHQALSFPSSCMYTELILVALKTTNKI